MVRIQLTVKGLKDENANGVYVISDEELNGHDLHIVKQHSGVRLSELADALNAGDYDLVIALAHIALKKAGHVVPLDELMDLTLGDVRMDDASKDDEAAEVAADEIPLPSENDSSGSTESSSGGGGDDMSTGSGDSPATTPRSAGSPDSHIGSESDHATLAT